MRSEVVNLLLPAMRLPLSMLQAQVPQGRKSPRLRLQLQPRRAAHRPVQRNLLQRREALLPPLLLPLLLLLEGQRLAKEAKLPKAHRLPTRLPVGLGKGKMLRTLALQQPAQRLLAGAGKLLATDRAVAALGLEAPRCPLEPQLQLRLHEKLLRPLAPRSLPSGLCPQQRSGSWRLFYLPVLPCTG